MVPSEVTPQTGGGAPARPQLFAADLADAERLLHLVDVSAKRIPDGVGRFGSPHRPRLGRRLGVGGKICFAFLLDVLVELLFRNEHSVALRTFEAEFLFEVVAEVLVARNLVIL